MAAPPIVNPALDNPDPGDAYQALYDTLGDAYWQASDITGKDTIHGLQEEIGKIIDAIDQQQLKDNTDLFIKIGAQVQATNSALKDLQTSINSITKNITTAGKVISAITTVLSLFP